MGDKIKEIENSIEYQQKHVALLSSKLNDQLEALERWKKSGFISEICADALEKKVLLSVMWNGMKRL